MLPQRHLKPVNPTRFLQEPHRFGAGGRDDEAAGLEMTAAEAAAFVTDRIFSAAS
jgi:hypothetical protein